MFELCLASTSIPAAPFVLLSMIDFASRARWCVSPLFERKLSISPSLHFVAGNERLGCHTLVGTGLGIQGVPSRSALLAVLLQVVVSQYNRELPCNLAGAFADEKVVRVAMACAMREGGSWVSGLALFYFLLLGWR